MVAVVSNPIFPCLSLETPATSPSPARVMEHEFGHDMTAGRLGERSE
jgi:hypothetical protein